MELCKIGKQYEMARSYYSVNIRKGVNVFLARKVGFEVKSNTKQVTSMNSLEKYGRYNIVIKII